MGNELNASSVNPRQGASTPNTHSPNDNPNQGTRHAKRDAHITHIIIPSDSDNENIHSSSPKRKIIGDRNNFNFKNVPEDQWSSEEDDNQDQKKLGTPTKKPKCAVGTPAHKGEHSILIKSSNFEPAENANISDISLITISDDTQNPEDMGRNRMSDLEHIENMLNTEQEKSGGNVPNNAESHKQQIPPPKIAQDPNENSTLQGTIIISLLGRAKEEKLIEDEVTLYHLLDSSPLAEKYSGNIRRQFTKHQLILNIKNNNDIPHLLHLDHLKDEDDIWPIKVSLPERQNNNDFVVGVLKNIAPSIPDSRLNADFKRNEKANRDRGVIILDIKRIKKKGQISQKHDESTYSVFIKFKGNKRPVDMYYGKNLCPIHPYISPVILCKKCRKNGHKSELCENNPRCAICGNNHLTKNCRKSYAVKSDRKCPNCGGNHTAGYGGCKYIKNEKIAQKIQAYENISRFQARKLVSSETITRDEEVPTASAHKHEQNVPTHLKTQRKIQEQAPQDSLPGTSRTDTSGEGRSSPMTNSGEGRSNPQSPVKTSHPEKETYSKALTNKNNNSNSTQQPKKKSQPIQAREHTHHIKQGENSKAKQSSGKNNTTTQNKNNSRKILVDPQELLNLFLIFFDINTMTKDPNVKKKMVIKSIRETLNLDINAEEIEISDDEEEMISDKQNDTSDEDDQMSSIEEDSEMETNVTISDINSFVEAGKELTSTHYKTEHEKYVRKHHQNGGH